MKLRSNFTCKHVIADQKSLKKRTVRQMEHGIAILTLRVFQECRNYFWAMVSSTDITLTSILKLIK